MAIAQGRSFGLYAVYEKYAAFLRKYVLSRKRIYSCNVTGHK